MSAAPKPASGAPATPRPNEDPWELVLQPKRIAFSSEELVLEVDLLIGNRQPQPAENIRVQLGMISANPDQDRHCAAFHASAVLGEGNIPPFDLAAGAGGRMPMTLSLRRDALHLVHVAGRPMVVAMVLVDLRWRSGISIRRFGVDFMVGTAGQSGKLGPIWLDRPTAMSLAATRYAPPPQAIP